MTYFYTYFRNVISWYVIRFREMEPIVNVARPRKRESSQSRKLFIFGPIAIIYYKFTVLNQLGD